MCAFTSGGEQPVAALPTDFAPSRLSSSSRLAGNEANDTTASSLAFLVGNDGFITLL
jgi:hypothetical protein